ncbi:hypothetical protein [Streptomyces sp. WG7]|uniref:hypothetical protein n=1 Tax=Streptomyces sp. WG7 TaxID=3417650 RepID=UPI003CF259C8
MADIHELQLTLDLPAPLPPHDVDLCAGTWGRQTAGRKKSAGGTTDTSTPSGTPVGRRGGSGACWSESCARTTGGWALTVRQEAHPGEFDDLRRTVRWLGERTTSRGAIGHLRFYESHVPDVLIAQEGSVSCAVPRVDELVESVAEVIPVPQHGKRG